jgi:hypothetical protein
MRNMNLKVEEDILYIILKVDKSIIIRDARITQTIENPFRYFVEGRMDFRGGGTMRATWKQ